LPYVVYHEEVSEPHLLNLESPAAGGAQHFTYTRTM